MLCATGRRVHAAPVKAAALVNTQNGVLALTASQDHTLGVWDVALGDEKGKAASMSLRCVGASHTGEVSCLAVDPERNFVCSGSWDETARLWRLDVDALDAAAVAVASNDGQKKRQRTGADVAATDTTPASAGLLSPSMAFEGHKGAVTGVAWASTRSLFTGSYDHNIVSWDVEAGTQLNVLYGSKAVNGLDYNPLNALVASCHPDNAVRIWDPRVGGNAVGPTATFRSHLQWVSSVRWCATGEHYLASASYDGSVKVWDIRAQRGATHTIEGAHGGGKVLCVDWSQSGEILSGGSDNQVKSHVLTMPGSGSD